MNNEFSEIVKEKIQKAFPQAEQKLIFEEFEKLNKYFDENEPEAFLESNEIEKIHLGILKLSDGKMAEFYDAINEAKSDWRNILYWSGMAEDDSKTE